ncbi:carbon-nitrogen hydrolase family protein [Rhizobium oryzicola]|uniref:Carbon-nitrogen hydrolase family protein n=1 Tax=Rhizobium oryzicola TaxID=1232668 RepID=A0ABT8SQ05_9HYPH|nr:carbon-nitrogen hydrolase family protein [Rhizobium oryzicola]MDO1580585.1 carbon-nitrogen hydrolase family protein [Rhizobium oryzicola]
MTRNANFKRRVRARAAKTGESYTTALSHIRKSEPVDLARPVRSLRLAVAQTTTYDDPRDISQLRAAGVEIRRLMQASKQAGARLLHLPEGATCSPNKRIMSSTGRHPIGPSDWSRFEWAVQREELNAVRLLARELELWTVLGAVHQLSGTHRPYNCLYVISDSGELVTRYDERMLSNTKISFMYSPGTVPITFEVDAVRFGLSLGMEVNFPEIFREYEQMDVDCVLFSTTGGTVESDAAFAIEAQGHAASNRYWVSFATLAKGEAALSGIARPEGGWAARCNLPETPSIAVADIELNGDELARPWRRQARLGLYRPYQVEGDIRSDDRLAF